MAFWQNRSISLVDMYIDNSEPTENVGQIHFSLEYDFQNTTLILKIMQVRIYLSIYLVQVTSATSETRQRARSRQDFIVLQRDNKIQRYYSPWMDTGRKVLQEPIDRKVKRVASSAPCCCCCIATYWDQESGVRFSFFSK